MSWLSHLQVSRGLGKPSCLLQEAGHILVWSADHPNPHLQVSRPRRKVRDPNYPVPVELPVLDTERHKSHIDLIPPTHPLLGISKACLSYQEEDRPTAVELCDHISGLKLTAEYTRSVESESEDKSMLEIKDLKAIISKNETMILSLKKDIELLKLEKEERCAGYDTIPTWAILREEIQIITGDCRESGGLGCVNEAVYHDSGHGGCQATVCISTIPHII